MEQYVNLLSISCPVILGTLAWIWHAKIQNRFNAKDKMVLITGCDTGIGYEISKLFLEWGFKVVSCCLHLDEHGATTLRGLGATVLKLDLFDEDSVADIVKYLNSKELYCLVNNAGVMSCAPTEWQTAAHIKSQIQVNLYGLILVTKMLLPNLRKAKGRIINVCSAQGSFGSPDMSIYCASKGAVEIFSHALRREISKDEVALIILRPCNLPLKTGILKQNAHQLEEMEQEMTEEEREKNKEKLKEKKDLFEKHFSPVESCQDLKDKRLEKAFWESLTSPKPKYAYTAASLPVRLLLAIIPMLPTYFADFIVKYEIHNYIISSNH